MADIGLVARVDEGVGATAEPKVRRARSRHWRGLDGLRAVAVVGVVAYHIAPSVLPGGFLGVDVFFVLSGFLITSGLLGEWRRRDGIDLGRFWLRRIRRLYPAVLVLLAVVVLVTAAVAPDALAGARSTIPASLVYLTNWWFVFHRVPYFQAVGRPPVLLHLWSLAIEEQYYLVWPPLLLAALSRRARPRVLAGALVLLAAASATEMALLFHPGLSTDRIYYGSDTHAQGLLLGSALGLVANPARFSAAVSRRARHLLDGAALVALAAVVAAMAVLTQTDRLTWLGGIGAVSVLSAVLVVVAVHPASVVARGLGIRPLRWLGTRSYSIYLWHWPILDLTRPADVGFGGVGALTLRVGLIGLAAEGSYRAVEQPWRTGAAQRWLRTRLADRAPARRSLGLATAVVVVGLAGLVVSARAPRPPGALSLGATAAATVPVRAVPPGPGRTRHVGAGTPIPTAPTLPPPVTSSTTTLPPPLPPGMRSAGRGGAVLAIGDSVMLGASPDLSLAFGPPLTVDAVVGRQVDAGLARLDAYRRAGRLHGLRALIVGLGSNGPFAPSQLSELERLAAGVPRVVLVNVRVPLPWQAETNATLESASGRPGWVVADWDRVSAGAGLLYPDGVHPDPAGQLAYTNLLVAAVVGH